MCGHLQGPAVTDILHSSSSMLVPCCSQLIQWGVQANAGEVSELTLGYNFGRLHEANGDLKQAQTLFSVSPCQCCDLP